MNVRRTITFTVVAVIIAFSMMLFMTNLFGWITGVNPFPIWLMKNTSETVTDSLFLVHDGILLLLLALPFALLIWRLTNGRPWGHVAAVTAIYSFSIYWDYFPTLNWYAFGVSVLNVASLSLATAGVMVVARIWSTRAA